MDQDTTWHGSRPWPRRQCVRWRPSSPFTQRGTAAPYFTAHCSGPHPAGPRFTHNPYCRLGSVRRADLRASWQSYQIIDTRLVMVALWNRADHYIFALWFLLLLSFFFFSSPNLSRRRLDVCHNSTHDVALVRI